ncbi:MAG TPA: hypothetical protein VHM20_08355 [Gammaproteobacteria bacterium]|nr:hypothetical protein [Gammaproteobacteria bacterium]
MSNSRENLPSETSISEDYEEVPSPKKIEEEIEKEEYEKVPCSEKIDEEIEEDFKRMDEEEEAHNKEAEEEKAKDEKKYEFVESAPYSLNAYTAQRLNDFLFGRLVIEPEKKNELKLQGVFNDGSCGIIVLRQADAKKIAVLNTASCPLENAWFSFYNPTMIPAPTLQWFLDVYSRGESDCAQILIPITEIQRNHFRLLFIDREKNKAILYDSKSKLIGWTADSLTRDYAYIKNCCEIAFPGITFTGEYLGHQGGKNHTDCGPFVADYLMRILLGQSIPASVDAEEARSRQIDYIKITQRRENEKMNIIRALLNPRNQKTSWG